MTATPYLRILQRTCDRVHISRSNIFTEDQKALRTFHSDRLEEGWRNWWWPDLMRVEQRFYRNDYASGTTYAALDEVYYPAEDTYYSALRATTGNAPTDLSYWAVATESQDAADFDATLVYVQADRVLYLGTVYQMHTASGVAGTLPSDTSYWGPTQQFIRSIARDQSWETNEIGTVRDMWLEHPDATTRAREAGWHQANGVYVVESPVNSVYVRFRLPAPELHGDVFDATATYAVGDQVFYTDDFYNCIVATAAGESPDTTAASWSVVEIPDFLAGWLEKAAAGDFQLSREQLTSASLHWANAERELADQQSHHTAAQGELGRSSVP